MRIYVASLSDYNAGNLHGAWIELDDKDSDEVYAEIDEMLGKSRELVAEEYAIHDHEGFPIRVREYDISELLGFMEEYNQCEEWEREAFLAYLGNAGAFTYVDYSSFEDAYHGEHDSALDFAYDLIEGNGMLEKVPEDIANYFDYEAYARDLGYEGWSFVDSDAGTVYVFAP